ncbi:MAG: Serine/threonine protein kinase [Labilithrix sp.]|nr:Serine/threonine protein kinase [Labilithrix sp.]
MSTARDPRLVSLRDSLAGRVLRGSGEVSYHLRECIGEGGQGWVFRANWDDPSGHVVIVKVLRPDVVATEALHRFEREAQVLRMLSTQGRPNPYIVRFYDHAVAQVPSPHGPEPLVLPFTVLEYVDGTTLEKVLADQKGRGLPAERTRRLVRQIAQALDMVHAHKVVHRDLKPSNILLATEAGTEIAKVTDFGLVKLVEMNLQRTAALAGASLGYAPPEQYEQGNQRVSPRTDIFSLAAVVYEMLTGKPAFPFVEGENPLLIVTRILNGPRPTLMKNRSTLAPELERQAALVEQLDRELVRAFAADPGARHESVMDLFQAIEPALRAAAEDKPAPAAVSGFDATARVEGSAPPPAPAANAGVWSWRVLQPPTSAAGSFRGVSFRSTGDAALAITHGGLLRFERGWSQVTLPAHVPRAALRGVRWMSDGGILLFGESSLVARLAPNGSASVWRVPDPEITFLGAYADPSGSTTLVGERPYRGTAARAVAGTTAGVVVQLTGDRVTLVSDALSTSRLHSVTRLTSGALVACGDWGALERIELGITEHLGPICRGHLTSIAPLPNGGAVTVGVGGHALSLTAKLEPQLEAVQTTRDLLSLATTEDGQAWAGSAQARLLRRAAAGAPGWVRMSGDMGLGSSMIALWAQSRVVRAVGNDGAVVEGRIA